VNSLDLVDVRAGYGEVEVLHGVSLHLDSGLITCLIGANGAGKSTALKALFGILRATSGRVELDGHDITSTSTADRLRMGISYVAQGRCNFSDMTVRENLEMGAYLLPAKGARSAVQRVLEQFPVLSDRPSLPAGALSGGQQQLLEMGMALVMSPKVLLIDEPSLGLSPLMVNVVFDEIVRIGHEGVTVVMVEQNAVHGLEIADRGAALELGIIRKVGTGRDLLNDPDMKLLYLGGARTGTDRGADRASSNAS
jgi:branched-chain amino acid transport system ATP-binding protein